MLTDSNRYLAEKAKSEILECADYLDTFADINDVGDDISSDRLRYLAARLRGDTGAVWVPALEPDPVDYPVVGSWVVFDPTGRDLEDCLVVGCVVGIEWNSADGAVRPILTVRENGNEDPHATIGVSRVFGVVASG